MREGQGTLCRPQSGRVSTPDHMWVFIGEIRVPLPVSVGEQTDMQNINNKLPLYSLGFRMTLIRDI